MTSLIREIVCAARKTFPLVGEQGKVDESLRLLKHLLSQLTAADIGLTAADVAFQKRFLSSKLPVKFMDIHEEDAFTVTAVVVAQNQKVPLHDHPGMNGLIKCIAGKIRVTSYTRLPTDRPYVLPASLSAHVHPADKNHLIPCLKHDDLVKSCDDAGVFCLTPSRGNIHEVVSESAASAFVDILGPPYGQESDCHYYKVIGSAVDHTSKQEITWLLKVHPPASYFTEAIAYRGPNL